MVRPEAGEAAPNPNARVIEFTITDGDNGAAITAHLIEDGEIPLGPIDGAHSRVLLPARFRGRIVAPGYLPSLLALDDSPPPTIRIALRRAACASGSLPAELRLRGAHITLGERGRGSMESLSATGTVDERNRFHVGPLAASDYGISLDAKGVLLRPASRMATLAAGPNELGELALEVLHPLWLRLDRPGGSPNPIVYARLWFEGGIAPRDLPGAAYPIDAQGLVRIDDVRDSPVAVEIWSAGGEGARHGSVLARNTSEESPLDVTLAAPATLVVAIDALGVRLPPGCELVVHPTDGHAATTRFVATMPLPELRGRRVRCSDAGATTIDALWPGPVLVTLLSPQGSSLAAQETEARSGARIFVQLEPRPPLATLVLANTDPTRARRFGLLSTQSGAAARAKVPAAEEVELVLPEGTYRILELQDGPHGAARGASEPIALQAGTRHRVPR